MLNIEVVKSGIIEWIREMMYWTGGKKAVIGISGGKDSSVVAALCVEALGKENVIGILMPQGEQSDIQYSYDLVNHLGIEYFLVNIGETVEVETKSIETAMGIELSKQAKINLPARIRMATLFGVAQTLGNGRVVNTSNLSEDWVGFATIGGDNMGAFAPIAMLTTEEVMELGLDMGIPEHLVVKKPSDGLTGKTDEEVLGFSYEVLNKYIRTGICEDNVVKEKINKLNRLSRFKFLPIPMYNPYLEIKADDIAHIYD